MDCLLEADWGVGGWENSIMNHSSELSSQATSVPSPLVCVLDM